MPKVSNVQGARNITDVRALVTSERILDVPIEKEFRDIAITALRSADSDAAQVEDADVQGTKGLGIAARRRVGQDLDLLSGALNFLRSKTYGSGSRLDHDLMLASIQAKRASNEYNGDAGLMEMFVSLGAEFEIRNGRPVRLPSP